MQQHKSLKILITGAAGRIAYSFLPLLCSGEVFGKDINISLNLLDLPEMINVLKGVVCELEDCGFPLLKEIKFECDQNELYKDVDLAIFLGGSPRKPGMERRDLLEINAGIFKEQGKILNEYAKKECKILVVANPVNTNCLILQQNCPNISSKNFTCMSRLDLNRAKTQIAKKLNGQTDELKQLIIWGNHSITSFPDLTHAKFRGKSVINEINDETYINDEFVKKIQKRGSDILTLRKNSAVISGAYAIKDHLKYWYLGTQENDWDSMGVYSDGSFYNIPKGIFFSAPVKCKNFDYEIIRDLKIDEKIREKIDLNVKELQKEKKEVIE